MIYYFSATGNSKWAAEELARGTGDTALSITEIMKRGKLPPPVKSGETLALVFPVFAFAPPRLVIDFVRKLEVADDAFVYAVCTMGGAAGGTFRYLEKFIRLDSCYSIKMPSNYIVMSDREPEKGDRREDRKSPDGVPGDLRQRKVKKAGDESAQRLCGISGDRRRVAAVQPLRLRQKVPRHRAMYRLRPLRRALPAGQHHACKRQPALAWRLHALHGLHPELPRRRDRVWRQDRRSPQVQVRRLEITALLIRLLHKQHQRAAHLFFADRLIADGCVEAEGVRRLLAGEQREPRALRKVFLDLNHQRPAESAPLKLWLNDQLADTADVRRVQPPPDRADYRAVRRRGLQYHAFFIFGGDLRTGLTACRQPGLADRLRHLAERPFLQRQYLRQIATAGHAYRYIVHFSEKSSE